MTRVELQQSINKAYTDWSKDQTPRNLNKLLRVIKEYTDDYCARVLNSSYEPYIHGELAGFVLNHVSKKLPTIEIKKGKEFFPLLAVSVKNKACNFFSSKEFNTLLRESAHIRMNLELLPGDTLDEAIPDGTDMEQDLIIAELAELTLGALRKHCERPVDYRIIEGLSEGHCTGVELSKYVGCTQAYICARVKYLRERLDEIPGEDIQ